jgi:transposase-like protein
METMEKQRRPRRSFSREFKAEVVELVRQPGNAIGSVSRDFDEPDGDWWGANAWRANQRDRRLYGEEDS